VFGVDTGGLQKKRPEAAIAALRSFLFGSIESQINFVLSFDGQEILNNLPLGVRKVFKFGDYSLRIR
jgi:hypothetical protein